MVFKRTIHFDDTQVDIIVNALLPEAKEISTVLCPGYNPDTELSPLSRVMLLSGMTDILSLLRKYLLCSKSPLGHAYSAVPHRCR